MYIHTFLDYDDERKINVLQFMFLEKLVWKCVCGWVLDMVFVHPLYSMINRLAVYLKARHGSSKEVNDSLAGYNVQIVTLHQTHNGMLETDFAYFLWSLENSRSGKGLTFNG